MNNKFLEYIVQQSENHIDLCPLRIEEGAESCECECPSEWFTGFLED